MIRLIDVTVQFPGAALPALAGVAMEIPAGSAVAVMGANGSGKSTLALLTAALIAPTTGFVMIDGVSTRDVRAFPEVRKRIGIVFQDPRHQITSMTVEREIAFGLQNLRHDEATISKRVDDALAFAGLKDPRSSHPMSLSGGEQQRLAVAAVLAMEPDILILDEVTSLLSPASRAHVLQGIANLRRSRDFTVLMMTQFPAEALATERLILLNNGRIVLDGPPADVFSHRDELRRYGIGLPSGRG